MEQKLRKTMKNIQQQLSFHEEIDIRTVLKRKRQPHRAKIGIILITVACSFVLFITDVPSTVANLFGTSTEPPHPYGQYLVHNQHYYVSTSESVSKEQLGRELGEVSRTGDWKFLREGDTTEYIPGAKYYSVQGNSTEEVIAVEKMGGTAKKTVVKEYQVLKRAKPLEKVNVKRIFGGKNDPQEVQAVYDNIWEVIPFLKILQSPDVEMTSIVLRNDGSNYYVKMMYRPIQTSNMGQTITLPGANHTTEKWIFIQEYQEEFGKGKEEFKHITSDGDFPYDPDKKIETFHSNDLEWNQYNRIYEEIYQGQFDNYGHVYRAKSDGIVYEVSSQGCSVEEMKNLLATFVQSPNK